MNSRLSTFTSYGRGAGSARVRVFDWVDWLKIDARSETFMGTASNSLRALIRHPLRLAAAQQRLARIARSSRLGSALVSRQATPFSRGQIEARLLTGAQRGVYDFDDALMVPTGGQLERLWPKSQIWSAAVRAADIVIAGNDYLAERAAELTSKVAVIPSCVNPSLYTRKTDYALDEVPRAVWLGSPSTEHYLRSIEHPLLGIHRSTGLRLTVVSAGSASLGGIDEMVDRVDWRLDSFSSELAKADFGIMPLADNEWTRGKCAYKLLQYGAAALPLIGSPVGVNRRVLSDGDGLAPITNDDWSGALQQVITSGVQRRQAMGTSALHLVERDFSFSSWEEAWREAVGV